MNSLQQSEFVALVKVYIKKWKLFVLSFIVCLGLAGAYLTVKNPEFKSAANILIKEDSKSGGMSSLASSMMKGVAFGDMLSVGGSVVDDEIEVISSYSILYNTVKELGLNTTYEEGLIKKKHYYGNQPLSLLPVDKNMADTFKYHVKFKVDVDGNENVKVKAYYKRDKLAEVKSKFPVTIKTAFGDFVLDKTLSFEKNKDLSMKIMFNGYSGTTQALKKNIDISQASKKANVINLSVDDELPSRGRDILNTIIKNYNDYGIAEKNITAERTAEFLQQRIDIMDADLKSVERAVEDYKESNNLTDIESEAKIILDKSSDFKEQLISAETQYTVISMIEDFLKDPKNRYAVVPMSLGIEEKSAVESLLSYNELLLERLKLLRSTNPGNPIIESMNEQVDATRQSVLVTIQSIKRGIEYARNDLRMQEETFMNRIKGMPKQEREYIEIKRQQEIKQALYIYLLQQQEENALKMAMANPKAQIIDNAFTYNIPVKPMKKLIVVAALLFSVLLPIIYIYLNKMFASRFESRKALQPMCSVLLEGDLHHSDRNILFSGNQNIVDEDMRNIRSCIFKMFEGNIDGKALLVSSINEGEGKTFVARNLALSIAKLGKRVLLVDADLRRSSGSLSDDSEIYHVSNKGLSDVVKKTCDLDSVIKPSILNDNLYILPSGDVKSDFAEVLMSKNFSEIISKAEKSYDFVLLDSVQLYDYSDSVALFNLADGVLFVTRSNYSNKQSIGYLESLIDSNKLRYACIVNDVKSE